ncbi:MAG: hypothetical protein AMJ84_06525 [Acidithiobacillales bacterium SM23_46]|nr:MAG: hypothetical protein AMJ84_06525 [Acidithiobacillales bacterium SM23_46]
MEKAVNEQSLDVFVLDETRRNAWKPRERLTVTQWANAYRQLTGSSMPGPYDVRMTPYLQGVMDAFNLPNIEMVAFVKSAQVGGTEALNNMIGFAIDQEPGPILYVYPTEGAAKEECRERLSPMIEQSPKLAAHITTQGWNTLQELELDNVRIYMAWAKAQSTLIRRAIRWAFIDEVDNCDQQAGRLGNTVKLVRKRLTTFTGRCKLVLNSTPSVEHASAWQTYLNSDRRAYHVPCPKCGEYQVLRFEQIKVPEKERDSQRIRRLDLAWYECDSCGAELKDNKHKPWMVERGVWLTHTETITQSLPVNRRRIVERAAFDHPQRWLPAITGDPPLTDVAGFHINALYSLWRNWSEIIAEFLECKDDPESLRVFVNATLGEPWREAIEEVKVSELEDKREKGLPRDVVPKEVNAIVVGADVQKTHIYYIVRGWGQHRESWLIRHGICMTLDELMVVARKRYDRQRASPISAMVLAIDANYRTHEVYEFARANPGVRCCKGQQAPAYSVRPSPVQYTLGKSTVIQQVMLFHVNTSMYKEMLHRMIHTPMGDPGCSHLYLETEDDYCNQVTAETQVWKTVSVGRAKRRVAVWEPKTAHEPNHYLDAEVYGLAIADFSGLLATRRPVKLQATAERSQKEGPTFATPDGRPFLATERS